MDLKQDSLTYDLAYEKNRIKIEPKLLYEKRNECTC